MSSSSLPTVALIGATGNLGSAILSKLLTTGYPVTIVTREGSTSTANLPAHPQQTIKTADYTSKASLTAALRGAAVVISTVTTTKAGDQELLIDAALATGTVTRFIPSDFGSDIFQPANAALPVYGGKLGTARYLERLADEHPAFSWTAVQNNVFFDWGLRVGFVVNPAAHTATLWDGGDVPFSTTRLSTVADTVVAVLTRLESTKNRVVRVHDAVVTQNQLIAAVKKVDGQEWETSVKSVAQEEADAYAELQKPGGGDPMRAMMGFLIPAIWGPGRAVYSSQVDNEEFGIKELSPAEVDEVVKAIVKG